jgi:ribonuclease Y
MPEVLIGIAALAVGVAAGYWIRWTIARSNARSVEARAQMILLESEQEIQRSRTAALEEAKEESSRLRRETEDDLQGRRSEVVRLERRITETEQELRDKIERLESRAIDLDERDEKLAYVRDQLEKASDQHRAQLERIAGLTSTEAKEQLMAHVIEDAKRAAMSQVREIEQRAREEGEERARKILTRSSASPPSRPRSPP